MCTLLICLSPSLSSSSLLSLQRRTLEREVDPVLMQYRDPAKEQDFSQTMQARTDAKRTKGQAGQPFNIVNHEGPPRENHLIGHQSRGNREWNLLSHFPDKLHNKAPTQFNQDFQIECTKRKPLLTGDTTLTRGRDYSILSNKSSARTTRPSDLSFRDFCLDILICLDFLISSRYFISSSSSSTNLIISSLYYFLSRFNIILLIISFIKLFHTFNRFIEPIKYK